jgi:hypothetical protein
MNVKKSMSRLAPFAALALLAGGCIQFVQPRPYNFAAVAEADKATQVIVRTLGAQGHQATPGANGLVATTWERVRDWDTGTLAGVYLVRYAVALTQGNSKALAVSVQMDMRQCPLGTQSLEDAVATACPRAQSVWAEDQQRLEQLGRNLDEALKVQALLNE